MGPNQWASAGEWEVEQDHQQWPSGNLTVGSGVTPRLPSGKTDNIATWISRSANPGLPWRGTRLSAFLRDLIAPQLASLQVESNRQVNQPGCPGQQPGSKRFKKRA